MPLSTVLLIPGDTEIARELINALRYEKTVRLFVANTDTIQATPHRTVPFGPLPSLEASTFHESLQQQLQKTPVDYVIPTSETARIFFRENPQYASVFDTNWKGDFSPIPPNSRLICDCYSKRDHTLIFAGLRHLNDAGIWQTDTLPEKVRAEAVALAKKHSIQGPWRLALDDSHIIQGADTGLAPVQAVHRPVGYNPALLLLHEARDNPVSVITVNAVTSMEASDTTAISLDLEYKTVFLDLDDTLIVHGAINDTVMSFVYHCKANNIPVHLITRHFRDPAITLCEFGIAEMLFESVIWIQDGSPKSSYMADAPAPIFIDDAFSERSEVASNTDIACLTPDAVQALMTSL